MTHLTRIATNLKIIILLIIVVAVVVLAAAAAVEMAVDAEAAEEVSVIVSLPVIAIKFLVR